MQKTACSLDPAQVFTLTNLGTVPLSGVAQATLTGTNTADFAIVASGTTCGKTGYSTLAANASCLVTVQFKPLKAEAAGTKTATAKVGYTGGSQTALLTGTAK